MVQDIIRKPNSVRVYEIHVHHTTNVCIIGKGGGMTPQWQLTVMEVVCTSVSYHTCILEKTYYDQSTVTISRWPPI